MTEPAANNPSAPRPSHFSLPASIDVAAGLVFRDGKLLITQRHPDSHLGGLWEFPGGKREPGETFAQCLVRELREELGIEVEVGEVLESLTHEYPDQTVRLEFFRCRWRRHEPQPMGCSALAWITATELKEYQFPAADALLIETLQNSSGLWCEELSGPGAVPRVKPGLP
jgi:mutator protein MutT